VLRSVADAGGLTREGLTQIFGDDLSAGAGRLERFLQDLGVSTDFRSYGIAPDGWKTLILDAFDGERGQNFTGTRPALLRAAGLSERESMSAQ